MKNKAAQQLGKLGGQKTAERGSNYYRDIGKQGAAKRWRKPIIVKSEPVGLPPLEDLAKTSKATVVPGAGMLIEQKEESSS